MLDPDKLSFCEKTKEPIHPGDVIFLIRGSGSEFVKFSNGPNTNYEYFNLLN
jgi:hypothetical protein